MGMPHLTCGAPTLRSPQCPQTCPFPVPIPIPLFPAMFILCGDLERDFFSSLLALLCQTHSRAGSRTRNAHRGQVAMRAIVARIALRTSGSDGVEKGPFFFFAPERL